MRHPDSASPSRRWRLHLALAGACVAATAAASASLTIACGNGAPGAGEDALHGGGAGLTYDQATNRVVVRARGPFDSLTGVFVRVRAGNLTATSLAELDCQEVARNGGTVVNTPTATPLTPADATGLVAYAGPTVSDTLRTPFYERETIGADPDAAQLARIAAGTDAVIDACVLRADTTLAKAQVSLLRAWDDATPDLAARVRAVEADGGADPKAVFHDVTSYGAYCEAELGPIPFFPTNDDGSRGEYDCTSAPASRTVPITVTDGAGKTTDATTDPGTCDRPDWLRGSCAPFTRVQRAINAQGTRWVLVCRKPRTGQGEAGKTFNDIAMIGHNPVTGKACFFQNALYAKTDGTHIPSPGDATHGGQMWSTFNAMNCNGCHDSDPWIHSPWVDQLKYDDGHYVVPRMGDDPAYPLGSKTPYSLLAGKAMGWTMQEQVVATQASACTTCHRLGAGHTLGSDGFGNGWIARATGTDTSFRSTFVTPAFSDTAHARFMPPDLTAAGYADARWLASADGKAVTFLAGCAQAGNCPTKAVPSTAAP